MSELCPEEILELEFEYARETAAQAQNDRMTIVNLYVLLVGGVGSIAIALPQLGLAPTTPTPRGAYALLFALLALVGFFVLMKLVRLRQAWYESVRAMNTIKAFYLERFPDLAPAFLWKPNTIPPRGKPWTITFNLALLVILVDSASLAIAVYFADGRVPAEAGNVIPVVAALLYLVAQLGFYFYQLPISENGSTHT